MKIEIKIVYLILFSMIFCYSCETNPPNEPEIIQVFGKVFVTSDVDRAEIYLDDIFTGKYTPDTVSTIIDEHKITLSKEGFTSKSIVIDVTHLTVQNVNINLKETGVKKIVLLEDFANVSCDPCVTSNAIIKKLRTKYSDNLVVVKFSTNFPSPYDPFYLGSKPINDARMGYYNILFAPTIIIDGIHRPVPTDSTAIINDIEKRLSSDAQFNIESSNSISGNQFIVDVSATLLEKELNISDYRIYAAIVEEDISFDNPPGSNGETDFFDVMRTVLPDKDGGILIYNEEPNNMQFQTDISNEWNISNLLSVVFIQNIETKEILQSTFFEH
jgi:Outer membrane protein Omp28/PEGA domain